MENQFNKRKLQIVEFNENLRNMKLRGKPTKVKPKEIPDNIISKCPSCGKYHFIDEEIENLYVCTNCGYHKRLHAKERLNQILDLNYKELYTDLEIKSSDFLGYNEKLEKAKKDTLLKDSVVCARGKINNIDVYVAVMDSYFMMGSMGSVCGEKITLIAEEALKKKKPLIIFTTSGGARMQEGVISLFQMVKTSAAIGKLKEHELYIAVLTDPTTGGVSASFASLADITLAEPNALIGFAGKRVIEQTIKETLPSDFQKSEFLLEKGFIDKIVPRKELKEVLTSLLRLHNYN